MNIAEKESLIVGGKTMQKYKINLRLFETSMNTNVTTDGGLSVEMKNVL